MVTHTREPFTTIAIWKITRTNLRRLANHLQLSQSRTLDLLITKNLEALGLRVDGVNPSSGPNPQQD